LVWLLYQLAAFVFPGPEFGSEKSTAKEKGGAREGQFVMVLLSLAVYVNSNRRGIQWERAI
jgi:hypothetical protein